MGFGRKSKRFVRDVLVTGVSLGAGSSVLGSMNNSAANNASAALGTFGNALPTYGTVRGAGLVLGSVRGLSRRKKRKRRY